MDNVPVGCLPVGASSGVQPELQLGLDSTFFQPFVDIKKESGIFFSRKGGRGRDLAVC